MVASLQQQINNGKKEFPINITIIANLELRYPLIHQALFLALWEYKDNLIH